MSIAAMAQNLDILTQTFQKNVNRINLLLSKLFNNKTFLDTQKFVICKYIKKFDLWSILAKPQIIEKVTSLILFLYSSNHKVSLH